MHTIGVSLAAQPSKTWLASITWENGKAQLADLHHGVSDDDINGMAMDSDIVGIGCPFSWPNAFVEFLTKYTAGQGGAFVKDSMPNDLEMNYRLTDLIVKKIAPGINPPSPLSGATAAVTLRCAGILAKCGQPHASFEHGGYPPKFVEVFPPASLSQWGMPYSGYKTVAGLPVLSSTVTKLVKYKHFAGPWLNLGRWLDTCQSEVGAFEAVICSMSARAVMLGRVIKPDSPVKFHAATTEGWIWVPDEESLPWLQG